MRSVSEAALAMMMDVSNARNEDDQTARVIRQLNKRDAEVRADERQKLVERLRRAAAVHAEYETIKPVEGPPLRPFVVSEVLLDEADFLEQGGLSVWQCGTCHKRYWLKETPGVLKTSEKPVEPNYTCSCGGTVEKECVECGTPGCSTGNLHASDFAHLEASRTAKKEPGT